jgi:cullin-4
MYSFPSRSHNANVAPSSVVDLTNESPNSSPIRRFNNGVRPAGRAGLGAHGGAKKLVVKNLKTNTSWDSKAYLEQVWSQLEEALSLIFKERHNTASKEDLYRGVENVCRQGGASTIFTRLDGLCRAHMELVILPTLLEQAYTDNVVLLRAVLQQWTRWAQQMTTVRAIFFFLERSYLLSSSKPTLDQLTSQLFREVIFKHARLTPKIVDGACDLVAAARSQDPTLEKDLFRQAVTLFHALSTYTSSFEPRFLSLAQDYVVQWSSGMITELTVPQYVAQASELISRETERCEEFEMDSSTKRDLLILLEDHVIERQQQALINDDALATLLDNNAIAELTALYALLDRRRLGDKLSPPFAKWVEATGTNIVFASNTDDMIVHLLSLKRRLDLIWRTAFQRNETLSHALRDSFALFMNKTKKGDATWGTDNTKVGEMIAKYVDQLLRGGVKAIPDVLTARRASTTAVEVPVAGEEDNEDPDVDEDAEVNVQLDQVLDLFRFVQGKAVFEAFYKKDLARRLLMGRSASADAERSMLARLKTECGSGFTQNLEQMFKDVELAREELQSYKQRLEDRMDYEKGKALDLSVNILSSAAWPTYPDIPVIIPANVKRAIDGFELHYKSKHTGRKLDWKHALAHCQMRAKFSKGVKELVVSSFQAIILLLFNDLGEDQQKPYTEILAESGLRKSLPLLISTYNLHEATLTDNSTAAAEVKRTLQSLACAKLRPLTKHPKGKDVNDTDTFSINLNFDHPKYRVKINQVQLKETKEENQETHMRVAEDRNFETQAAIVRIMKSRKTISHSELVAEVIKATITRGVLGVADIKKNIDRLIEKDYMEREDGNMYSYVA